MVDYKDKVKNIEKEVRVELASQERRAKYIAERKEMCLQYMTPIIEKLNEAIVDYGIKFKNYNDAYQEEECIEFTMTETEGEIRLHDKFVCDIACGSDKKDIYSYKMGSLENILMTSEYLEQIVEAFINKELQHHIKIEIEKERDK